MNDPVEGSPALYDGDGKVLLMRRRPTPGDTERCPGCKELVAKAGKVPDRGFGKGTKTICGACGYEYS